jgi:hypothetical protein
MYGDIPPLPQHAFTPWWSLKKVQGQLYLFKNTGAAHPLFLQMDYSSGNEGDRIKKLSGLHG